MYEYEFDSIMKYLLPALIPIALFVAAETYSRKKQDERQKLIRGQAYKHAFVVLVALWFILSQADAYYAVIWNRANPGGIGAEGSAVVAIVIAADALILEQIIRGSFFATESALAFIIFLGITIPVSAICVADILQNADRIAACPEGALYYIFGNMIFDVSALVITLAAALKYIIVAMQRRRAE